MAKKKLVYPYNLVADIMGSKAETNVYPFDIEITMDYLLTLLSTTNDMYAEILRHYYQNEMKQTEIARKLGITQATVSKKMQEALKWLREESRLVYIQYGITGVGACLELRGYQRGLAQRGKHLPSARRLTEKSACAT